MKISLLRLINVMLLIKQNILDLRVIKIIVIKNIKANNNPVIKIALMI